MFERWKTKIINTKKSWRSFEISNSSSSLIKAYILKNRNRPFGKKRFRITLIPLLPATSDDIFILENFHKKTYATERWWYHIRFWVIINFMTIKGTYYVLQMTWWNEYRYGNHECSKCMINFVRQRINI